MPRELNRVQIWITVETHQILKLACAKLYSDTGRVHHPGPLFARVIAENPDALEVVRWARKEVVG